MEALLETLDPADGEIAIAEPGGDPLTSAIATVLVGPEGGLVRARARGDPESGRSRLGRAPDRDRRTGSCDVARFAGPELSA